MGHAHDNDRTQEKQISSAGGKRKFPEAGGVTPTHRTLGGTPLSALIVLSQQTAKKELSPLKIERVMQRNSLSLSLRCYKYATIWRKSLL